MEENLDKQARVDNSEEKVIKNKRTIREAFNGLSKKTKKYILILSGLGLSAYGYGLKLKVDNDSVSDDLTNQIKTELLEKGIISEESQFQDAMYIDEENIEVEIDLENPGDFVPKGSGVWKNLGSTLNGVGVDIANGIGFGDQRFNYNKKTGALDLNNVDYLGQKNEKSEMNLSGEL